MNGIGMGLFAAPNTTGIMNSVPAGQRGAASGMRATFQNTGMVLSIGLFFRLMIVGLAEHAADDDADGARAQRRAAGDRARRSPSEPPVGSLFAAFLGYNPMEKLVARRDAASRCDRRTAADHHRQGVLPRTDLRAVHRRPAHRLHRARSSCA